MYKRLHVHMYALIQVGLISEKMQSILFLVLHLL